MTDAVGTAYGLAMYEHEGALATWRPDKILRVGDVVSRSEDTGALTVETTLAELMGSTGYTISRHKGAPSIVMQSGVTVKLDTSAKAGIPGAHAELSLSFEKKSSYAFAARDTDVEEYDHVAQIRRDLLTLYGETKWDARWQLVTSVRSLKSATIVIAQQKGTSARITVDATAGLTGLEAASFSSGVTITSGAAANWILENATPLYEALQVLQGNWRRGTSVVDGRYLENATAGWDDRVIRSAPSQLSL